MTRSLPLALIVAATASTVAVPTPAPAASATPTLVTVAAFDGTHGATPQFGALAFDPAGNLYGTASVGGANNLGAVFRVPASARNATPAVLASFAGGLGGAGPTGTLTRDAAGNLFGTTGGGGRATDTGSGGYGTVFELPAGSATPVPLAAFDYATTGAAPLTGPVRGPDGALYATTGLGGPGGVTAGGAVVRYDPATARLATVAAGSSALGYDPVAPVTFDPAGNLFGTALLGGPGGNGSVYELPAGASAPLAVAGFTAATGTGPEGGLVRDAAGDLFGTTTTGGANSRGTIFEIPAGTSAVRPLASFTGANGANPHTTLLLDAAGDLFGTAAAGGDTSVNATGYGTVFELPAGSSTILTLATFAAATTGANPNSPLVADAAGTLYGTARGGGANNDGTVFAVLNSGFVVPVPEPAAAGLVVAAVSIIGRRRRVVPGPANPKE